MLSSSNTLFQIKKSRGAALFLALSLAFGSFYGSSLTAQAASAEELQEMAEARKSLPVQSNEIDNWPNGPQIGAEAAILMDANTGVILYAKNIHERLYPASTTKIMTCLLAVERGNLDDTVEFSHDAVFSVPSDGSNMGMDEGESLSLEECLYGIMVASANEAANAAAEYISGSIDEFVDLMNLRAKEIGCTDTHFVNTNGLHDPEHYTSAYDLALISSLFFQNEMLCKISNTARYHFEATATQPDDFYKNNKHQLINGDIPYDGILGGKTGFTSDSRQTLVTCAERNGMKLICVVFKEESPNQFSDTVELLDYGFQNFQVLNVSENEQKYNVESTGFLRIGNDVFGSSKPLLTLDTESYVIIPNTTTFQDLDSTINYNESEENRIAEIEYTYHDMYVGKAYLNLAADSAAGYEFDTNMTAADVSVEKVEPAAEKEPAQDTVFINIKKVLLIILIIAAVLITLLMIHAVIVNSRAARRRENRVKRKRKRQSSLHIDFHDFDL
ncbi:MAG: D-alanyl-D-alanine carboxypeptidase [bacterium]|nr:D-alanyl-D-alanine carboxypeptidase [bacterium]MCM1422754.1 D-alanyl-D-alanine carboxypeptidase [bacterium]